jgi:hypothetical protein
MAQYEEQLIIDFLKSQPTQWFSASEIARKSGDRRMFEAEPRWPIRYLGRLREKDIIEQSDQGQYRYLDPSKVHERREKARNKMGR